MSPQTLRLAPLALMLLIALLVALGLFNGKAAKESPLVGLPIATFSVPSLVPNMQFSPRGWHGQIAVLGVFGSWCAPCAAQQPLLMKLAQDRRIAVYGLALKDKPENVTAWLAANGNPFRQVGIDFLGATSLPLGLAGAPEIFIIDPDGYVRYEHKGPIDQDQLDNAILPLVAQLSAGAKSP